MHLLLILSSGDFKYLLVFEKYKTGVKGWKSQTKEKPFILTLLDSSIRQQREDDLQLKSKASLKPIKHLLNIIFNLIPLIQSATDQQLYQSY